MWQNLLKIGQDVRLKTNVRCKIKNKRQM